LNAARLSSVSSSEQLHEALLRQEQLKHAFKTALACCLAATLAYFFHIQGRPLAVVFAYLIMTMGMPSPRLNAVRTLLALAISATVSALLLVAFGGAPAVYLAGTLLWIFTCVLFSTRFSLPATMAAMVSAIGIFVLLPGTVATTLTFYVHYVLNWLLASFSVIVVQTLLWPLNSRERLFQRLAEVYGGLETRCRQAAARIRSGEPPAMDASGDWAPFRRLRQLVAPEARRLDATNPVARMILACRSLNVRLWFLDRGLAPLTSTALPASERGLLGSLLDQCAGQLHALFEGASRRQPVTPENPELPADVGLARTVLHRVARDVQMVTAAHNALLTRMPGVLAGDLVALRPAATGRPPIDASSARSGAKLVLLILLLVIEEGVLHFPGGSQVAFFAAFFASTGNLGRQNKTDLFGLAGLLVGFAYGTLAAFLTTRLPHFPLMLALVFLGEFLANLAFQILPRFGAAGMQAGLALPFAYLTTGGPEWGSLADVRTRFWGLIVAGFTAIVVHAYLWPVLPIRRLRALIANALRDTAMRVGQLFSASRSSWEGAPPSLDETVLRAADLLDDALYLTGSDHADPAYRGILGSLQEIDASLEYVHFLVGFEAEHALRDRFFATVSDYAGQALGNLQHVARQLQQSPSRGVLLEPRVRWKPDASGRWEHASDPAGTPPDGAIDPSIPAVIARCLDQIAQATERISSIAREIDQRSLAREVPHGLLQGSRAAPSLGSADAVPDFRK